MKFNNEQEVIKFMKETKGKEGRPTRIKMLSGHQWTAWKQIVAAANNIIGGYENACMDNPEEKMPSNEELFDMIFYAIHNEVNDIGYTNFNGGLEEIKFAGNIFLKGAIKYKMSVDGYIL